MSEKKVWKKPGNASSSIEFVRPSELAAKEFKGVLLEAVFIESIPNGFDNNKLDFKFEKEDGGVVVVNGAGNLGYQMREVSPGQYVQLSYDGMNEIEYGKLKGKMAHNFSVLIGE